MVVETRSCQSLGCRVRHVLHEAEIQTLDWLQIKQTAAQNTLIHPSSTALVLVFGSQLRRSDDKYDL